MSSSSPAKKDKKTSDKKKEKKAKRSGEHKHKSSKKAGAAATAAPAAVPLVRSDQFPAIAPDVIAVYTSRYSPAELVTVAELSASGLLGLGKKGPTLGSLLKVLLERGSLRLAKLRQTRVRACETVPRSVETPLSTCVFDRPAHHAPVAASAATPLVPLPPFSEVVQWKGADPVQPWDATLESAGFDPKSPVRVVPNDDVGDMTEFTFPFSELGFGAPPTFRDLNKAVLAKRAEVRGGDVFARPFFVYRQGQAPLGKLPIAGLAPGTIYASYRALPSSGAPVLTAADKILLADCGVVGGGAVLLEFWHQKSDRWSSAIEFRLASPLLSTAPVAVKTLSGGSYKIFVSTAEGDDVPTFMQKVFCATGSPMEQQLLVRKGVELARSAIVAPGDEVTLVQGVWAGL